MLPRYTPSPFSTPTPHRATTMAAGCRSDGLIECISCLSYYLCQCLSASVALQQVQQLQYISEANIWIVPCGLVPYLPDITFTLGGHPFSMPASTWVQPVSCPHPPAYTLAAEYMVACIQVVRKAGTWSHACLGWRGPAFRCGYRMPGTTAWYQLSPAAGLPQVHLRPQCRIA